MGATKYLKPHGPGAVLGAFVCLFFIFGALPQAAGESVYPGITEELHDNGRVRLAGGGEYSKEYAKEYTEGDAKPSRGRSAQDSPLSEQLLHSIKAGEILAAVKAVKKGADPNITDSQGSAPLLYAAYDGNKELTIVLIEAGADVNRQDASGWTPLLAALYAGNTELVPVLVDAGADITKPDPQGALPLFYAVFRDDLHSAELLLKQDAGHAFSVRDKNGLTALDLALRMEHLEMAELLQSYGIR